MASPYFNRFVVIFFALLALSTFNVSFGAPVERKLAASLKNKDIPWKDLIRRLSKKAKLIKASKKAFAKQCDPGFEKDPLERDVDIYNKKSGLCLDSFSCAFKDCLPGANHSLTAKENIDALHDSQVKDVEKWKDPSNPDYALPASVLFPNTAGDIVAAVEFANENKLELSIKSSGHNYAGQSSKKDTLLLNTKRFQKYAATGIVECDASASSNIQSDLSNQPCVLALARNKNGYIRVATGEPFIEAYGAVRDFNKAQGFKFHMVGGAQATVTPMGWTFQGGMAATVMGRYLGYGVDQVLMIEAVLPTGEFVRFGPTSFEDAEGFLVPKTLSVSGVCNQNPFDDEESWVWGPCAKDINFDDLWFAFRGGGGGTYGIATSVFLQLHEYKPLEAISWFPRDVFENCDSLPDGHFNMADYALNHTYAEFMLDFILEPSKANVSDEVSSSCGCPIGSSILHCFGKGAYETYKSAWKQRLENKKVELMSKGVPESSIDAAGTCLENKVREFEDYFSSVSDPSNVKDGDGFGPTPFPKSIDFNLGYKPPISLVFFKAYSEFKDVWVKTYSIAHGFFYHVVGGVGTNGAHDQMTSLPTTFREAAFYHAPFYNLTNFSTEALEKGYIAPNHMDPFTYGPLKELNGNGNLESCPLDKLTFAEADELCYSSQEATWGLETLARLEKIKATVDPNHILNCYKCVGYKKDSIAEFKPSKKKPKKSSKSRRAIV